MLNQRSIKRGLRRSSKRLLRNNINMPVVKEENETNDKETVLTWNRAALDAIAKNMFYLLLEPLENKIIELKSYVHELEQKNEIYDRELMRLKRAIVKHCEMALNSHEEYNYDNPLGTRNVGIQYPPKIKYVSADTSRM